MKRTISVDSNYQLRDGCTYDLTTGFVILNDLVCLEGDGTNGRGEGAGEVEQNSQSESGKLGKLRRRDQCGRQEV